MRAKTADRFGALISILLMIALAFGSYWMVRRMQTTLPSIPIGEIRHEPDAQLDDVIMHRTTASGAAMDRIQAEQARRYADNGDIELRNPRLQTLDPDRPKTSAQAEQALLSDDQSRLTLLGQVTFTRASDRLRRGWLLHTEHLIYQPDLDRAESPTEVVIERDGSKLQGKGLQLDNLAGTLQIQQRARLVLEPVTDRP